MSLNLTTEWDKVFPKSDKVDHKKVTFRNHFGIELAADMYTPKAASGKLPAIAVAGPYGAVKEQSSGLYAQEMAERGFIAIAFDPSYTGESGGEPRYVTSWDLNVEDYQAAIDFLSNEPNVDADKISIIGVCGWGGVALQTVCLDTRIKATICSTMYDMPRVARNGYFDADNNAEARQKAKEAVNAQRTEDYKNGELKLAGGVVDPLPEDAPKSVRHLRARGTSIRANRRSPAFRPRRGRWESGRRLGIPSPIFRRPRRARRAGRKNPTAETVSFPLHTERPRTSATFFRRPSG